MFLEYSLKEVEKLKTIQDFTFGDMVTYTGEYAEANGTPLMVVAAIQPENGLNGSIITYEKNRLIPIVCDPNELVKIKEEENDKRDRHPQ